MKIYTKTGDSGQTSLFSGQRVEKFDTRVEAYGTIDELNSTLGLLASNLDNALETSQKEIYQIQSILFTIGSWLATDPSFPQVQKLSVISTTDIESLEASIDKMTNELPELAGFILPGGHATAGFSQLCRSVCRRAERQVLHYLKTENGYPEEVESAIKKYINRLSDYLFTLARYCNIKNKVSDILWRKEEETKS